MKKKRRVRAPLVAWLALEEIGPRVESWYRVFWWSTCRPGPRVKARRYRLIPAK